MDHVPEKCYVSELHYSLVRKPISIKGTMKIPEAEAAVVENGTSWRIRELGASRKYSQRRKWFDKRKKRKIRSIDPCSYKREEPTSQMKQKKNHLSQETKTKLH